MIHQDLLADAIEIKAELEALRAAVEAVLPYLTEGVLPKPSLINDLLAAAQGTFIDRQGEALFD